MYWKFLITSGGIVLLTFLIIRRVEAIELPPVNNDNEAVVGLGDFMIIE